MSVMFFFFKQKAAYEMRISDWSSDVCSSDLGATYILPGVVEANESSIALLAITSDIGVGSRGRFALTELDQESLFRPVTKWNKVIDTSSSLPRTVRAAFRQMTSGRPGAGHLGLPFDVQKGPVDTDGKIGRSHV